MMNKTALILVASASLAVPAMAAEFNVNEKTKFQLNVEVGAYNVNLKNSSGINTKDFSGKGINQIEIKADHGVSSDVTLFGEIEFDYDPIGDNGPLSTDDVRLGINSKSMGRFSIGQFDSYFEDNVIEVLSVGHGEYGYLSEAASDNDGRHLQWIKSFGGVTLAVDASQASNTAKTDSDTALGVTAIYKTGALTFGFGHTKINKFKSDLTASKDGVANTSADSTTAASVMYKLGDLTLMGLVAKQDKLPTGKIDIAGAGLKYKMGAFDVGFAAQNLEETGKDKRTELTLGVGYTPFKNMTVYLDMRKLDYAMDDKDAVELGMKYAF